MTLYRIAVSFLLGALIIAKASFGSETPALKCQTIAEDGSHLSYVVSRRGGIYEIQKLVDDVSAASIEIPLSGGVEGYGGAHIYFYNAGRSGYLLIHHNAPKGADQRVRALIDINLFQSAQRALNTSGPSEAFECETP